MGAAAMVAVGAALAPTGVLGGFSASIMNTDNVVSTQSVEFTQTLVDGFTPTAAAVGNTVVRTSLNGGVYGALEVPIAPRFMAAQQDPVVTYVKLTNTSDVNAIPAFTFTNPALADPGAPVDVVALLDTVTVDVKATIASGLFDPSRPDATFQQSFRLGQEASMFGDVFTVFAGELDGVSVPLVLGPGRSLMVEITATADPDELIALGEQYASVSALIDVDFMLNPTFAEKTVITEPLVFPAQTLTFPRGGDQVERTVTYTGGSGDPVVFTTSDPLPSGVRFDPATGTFTGPAASAWADLVFTSITTGRFHTCATMADGSVRCWGENVTGQLGDGSSTNRSTPIQPLGLDAGVVQVSAAFGYGLAGASRGGTHTCAVLTDGTARCWGAGALGQLGDGTTTSKFTPTPVPGLSGVRHISAGDFHTCAVLQDGTAWCWGSNGQGQLGDGTTTQRLTPTQVSGLSDVVSISAGAVHTCAVTADGSAYCWGRNATAQLGDNTISARLTPTAVVDLPAAVEHISAGALHTCAVLADSSGRCWGDNSSNQLGDGTTTRRSTPTLVSGLGSGVEHISAGANHSCAVLTDGTARCWGANTSNQLGDGTTTRRSTPTSVSGLETATHITTNNTHTCALLADTTARCWGAGGQGQIGDGATTSRSTPASVDRSNEPAGFPGTITLTATTGTDSATATITLTID